MSETEQLDALRGFVCFPSHERDEFRWFWVSHEHAPPWPHVLGIVFDRFGCERRKVYLFASHEDWTKCFHSLKKQGF